MARLLYAASISLDGYVADDVGVLARVGRTCIDEGRLDEAPAGAATEWLPGRVRRVPVLAVVRAPSGVEDLVPSR